MDKQYRNEEDASIAENDQELNELADFAILSFESKEDEDPIIDYMQRLRAHFQVKNPHAFRSRFLKGYRVLLEEVDAKE
jgi:hypothetical protein